MAKGFTFKKFHINAFECGMPVSTDAVLLGAWANIEDSSSILDIGCGTGLLSIMCAQRNVIAEIIGVEIEHNAFQATTENYKNSLWDNRLRCIQSDIKNFTAHSIKMNKKFESIICNPPYFNDGEESLNQQRAIARHTTTLSHTNLLAYCEVLLSDNGKAHFVLPKKEGEVFINLLNVTENNNRYNLKLIRRADVKTTVNKPVTRILIEIVKQQQHVKVQYEQLTIHDGEGYSDEFIDLTKDFYLKM